jgi:3',5'-cyclic AMP phosphodiesterase CpdA
MKYFFFLITLLIPCSSCSNTEPILKIGLVADPQYAEKPTAGTRYYSESLWKLDEAIDSFNFYGVDFVQNLGDLIDSDWESYDAILPVYEKLHPHIENHHLLGNHDYEIDSAQLKDLRQKLSMPDYYYSYSEKGWRFIVLDATDYAYFSNPLHDRDVRQIDSYFENTMEKANHYTWNGAIGKEQLAWLEQQLDSAELEKQKVILFSHLPVRPQNDPHNLWNDEEVTDLMENSSSVVAFVNGHKHAGGYAFENGIHHITIRGMVENRISSYAILEIYEDHMVLKGFGDQETMHLSLGRKEVHNLQ